MGNPSQPTSITGRHRFWTLLTWPHSLCWFGNHLVTWGFQPSFMIWLYECKQFRPWKWWRELYIIIYIGLYRYLVDRWWCVIKDRGVISRPGLTWGFWTDPQSWRILWTQPVRRDASFGFSAFVVHGVFEQTYWNAEAHRIMVEHDCGEHQNSW